MQTHQLLILKLQVYYQRMHHPAAIPMKQIQCQGVEAFLLRLNKGGVVERVIMCQR